MILGSFFLERVMHSEVLTLSPLRTMVIPAS